MSTSQSKYWNHERLEIEGTFDLSAAAAVLTLTYPGGSTKTVRGIGMSVVKNGTGTYDVTCKMSTIGGPVFQPVELLDGQANFIGATVATTLDARIQSVATVAATGDLLIKVITAQTTGAPADTTGAITVAFHVVINTARDVVPL